MQHLELPVSDLIAPAVLRDAAESAVAFLKSVDWNDNSSETDAYNVIEELRRALATPQAPEAAPPVVASQETAAEHLGTPAEHAAGHWNYSGKPSEQLTDREVIADIIACAKSWEAGVRLLGNIRACDIARVLSTVLASPALDYEALVTLAQRIATYKCRCEANPDSHRPCIACEATNALRAAPRAPAAPQLDERLCICRNPCCPVHGDNPPFRAPAAPQETKDMACTMGCITRAACPIHGPQPEMIEQFCRDLNAAHDELLKLQNVPADKFGEYDWPEWSGPANSIRWAEKLTGKPLSKTSLRAAPPPSTSGAPR